MKKKDTDNAITMFYKDEKSINSVIIIWNVWIFILHSYTTKKLFYWLKYNKSD